jgi:hypothetical protein
LIAPRWSDFALSPMCDYSLDFVAFRPVQPTHGASACAGP